MSTETLTQKAKTNWFRKTDVPVVISGPCSVETEEQVLETCKRLKATGKVDILRGGIWKPRTRPGTFEGIGIKGLPWMQKVKEETGLPITVEVAKAAHVDACLAFGVDILWVGARTTVNPFAVQEIADAVRGVDIPILVKNPINPDLALWMGGMERFRAVGVEKLGAIHRGFSHIGEKFYRNRPEWQIAIEFMRQNPNTPLIGDPSHICGRRDILKDVSQKAIDLGFDGLMIESHIDPDNAWSDAKQQITPEVLGDMITSLKARETKEDDVSAQESLNYLRQEINTIDDDILNLFSQRMGIARKIGEYKKANNMTILQQKRWSEIIEKVQSKGVEKGLSKEFISKYIKAVHDESINQQEEIMKG